MNAQAPDLPLLLEENNGSNIVRVLNDESRIVSSFWFAVVIFAMKTLRVENVKCGFSEKLFIALKMLKYKDWSSVLWNNFERLCGLKIV